MKQQKLLLAAASCALLLLLVVPGHAIQEESPTNTTTPLTTNTSRSSSALETAVEKQVSVAQQIHNVAELLFETAMTRATSVDLFCRFKDLLAKKPNLDEELSSIVRKLHEKTNETQLIARNGGLSCAECKAACKLDSTGNACRLCKPDFSGQTCFTSDVRLLLRCTSFLQRNFCGTSTSPNYVGCLRNEHSKCFVNNDEYNIQQQRWVSRVLDISLECEQCAKELVEARAQLLLKWNDVRAKNGTQLGTATELEPARDVLEKKLCLETRNTSVGGALRNKKQKTVSQFENQIQRASNKLQKDFGNCLKRQFPESATKQDEKIAYNAQQCRSYLKNVLSVETIFGSRFLVAPKL